MPLVASRFGSLLSRWAGAYAGLLSINDLKAAIAFYDSPTGQRLPLAQPQLALAKLNAMTQWLHPRGRRESSRR
jgi:hypothetical protein